MKNPIVPLVMVPLTLASLLLAGCSKSNSGPVAMAPEQIPATMNQMFKQSSGETKELVNHCVNAAQNQQITTAFTSLQKLSRQNDLTPEQRTAAVRAMSATFVQLRAASEKGDPAAKALVRQYLSTR